MKVRATLIGCLSNLAVACARPQTLDEGVGDTTDTGETGELSDTGEFGVRRPFRDEWREELVLPAAELRHLVVGGPLTLDNFANRGDIQIHYDDDSSEVRVELQRFTIASDLDDATEAFGRMSVWAYDLESVERPSDEIMQSACGVGEGDFCHLRVYYDGLFQPVRDGANIRVTLPRGWEGELELETEDNLEEEDYPDRGDVLVDGLAGRLAVRLDSGRARVRLDPTHAHYPGCAYDDLCVMTGFAPDCGCTDFSSIRIEARSGRAADILVDVPVDNWYAAELDNDDLALALGCVVDVDCDAFPSCELDPDVLTDARRQASINYPGPPALQDLGIQIELHSGACSMIDHADSPDDYIEGPATEVRGNVRLCSGCWEP
jgi:hypothetical protein